MESLGTQISQFVERCRAQQAVRASDARKSAILNAAFDCIVTMDHNGDVVEVNRADRAHVRLPRGGDDRSRAGRADRAAGAARGAPARRRAATCETGRRAVVDHPLELDGDARRRQRVPGRAGRHPRRSARAAALLRLPARRHRAQRARARCCGGWWRSRRRCGAWRRRWRPSTDPRRVFGVVTEEVARLLRAQSSNMVRFNDDGDRDASSAAGARAGAQRAGRRHACRIDGDTASARVYRTGAPGADRRLRRHRRRARRAPARARLPLRRRRADLPRRAAVGRGDRLQRRPRAVPAGRRAADRRLRRAGRAGARQRAVAGGAGGVARPHRRRRATSSAAGWSATCTTARSSGSCRWR